MDTMLLAVIETVFLLAVIYGLCRFWGCRHLMKWRGLRPGVIGAVLLLLCQYVTGTVLFSLRGLPGTLLVLLWTLPYGFVRGHMEGEEDRDFSRLKSEFLLGASGGVLLTLLTGLPAGAPIIRGVGVLFLLFSIAAAAGFLVYYSLFHTLFDTGDMVPVLLTDWKEASSFTKEEIGYGKCAALAVLLIAAAISLWHLLAETAGPAVEGGAFFWGTLLLAAVLFEQYIGHAFPVKQLWGAHVYVKHMKQASARHARNIQKLKVTPSGGPVGTTVLIIGESANRDHMTCFNDSYPVDTTPWETAEKEKQGFYVFPNAYACFSQTAEVLPYLLSGMNQYNHTSTDNLVSLLDVAKAAGMDTWWFTNHGEGDTLTMTLARSADHARWTPVPKGDDAQLLDLLEDIPAEGNHFIVLHIMGSHLRYEDRVPSDFPKIQRDGEKKRINDYDTSIAYTDHILHRIYDIAEHKLHADTILYVSDHGEDMQYTHGTGRFTPAMVRIPLWIYLSGHYRQRNPERAEALTAHRGAVFTNDLTFDTLCGLMGIGNDFYTETFDLSSQAYDLPEEQAVTLYGEKKIMELNEKR